MATLTHTETHTGIRRETVNPFPGLRAFVEEEQELFFGRDRETEDILPILKEQHFLALVGNSGSGKTSFINCGLKPKLNPNRHSGGIKKEGYPAKAGTRWETLSFKPGTNPIHNLAQELHILAEKLEVKMSPTFNSQIQELAKENPEELEKIFSAFDPNFKRYNLLIFVDQFEDLFDTGESQTEDFQTNAAAFVRLLLEIRKQKTLPIYVVAAIRSDFIGHITEFPGLYEAIEESQFLLPRMKGEAVGRAIIGPIVTKGIPGKVSADITNELLQSLLDDYELEANDQLPILQHVLMRTWEVWAKEGGQGKLGMEHYTSVGTMRNALTLHIREAFQELTPVPDFNDSMEVKRSKEIRGEVNQKISAILFKSLTALSPEGVATQRPVQIGSIENQAVYISREYPKDPQIIGTERVREVIDIFLKPGRSFLSSTSGNDIRQNHSSSTLSISHESLIRRWPKLLDWSKDEAESAQIFLRLTDATEEYHDKYDGVGERGLYPEHWLLAALEWKKLNNPNPDWAARYSPDYDRSMAFLKKSEDAYNKEKNKRRREQEQRLRRARFFTILMSILALAAVVFLVLASIWGASAFLNQQKAKASNIQALSFSKDAIIAQMQAETQREKADSALKKAQIAKVDAEKARKKAEEEAVRARKAEEEAIENFQLAESQRLRGDTLLIKANAATERANRSLLYAEERRRFAESLQRRALAQAVAVKSEQVDSDYLQGMLARQAYAFNGRQPGDHQNVNFNEHDPIIYNALFAALAKLKGDDFNNLQVRGQNLHVGIVRGLAIMPVDKESTTKKTYETLFTTSGDGKVFALSTDLTKYDSVLSPFDKTLLPVNKRFLLPPKLYKHLAISNNNRWIAIAGDGPDMYFISTKNPTAKPRKMRVHRGRSVWDIAPFQNQYFAGFITNGGDGRVEFQSLSGNSIALLEPNEPFTCVAVSPDQKFLAGGTKSGAVFIWRFETFTDLDLKPEKRLVQEDGSEITSITFASSNKQIITGHDNGNVQLWDLNRGTYVQRKDHHAAITALEFHKSGLSGMIASSSYDNTTRIWKLDQFEKANYLPLILGDDDLPWATSVAFSTNGQYLWTGYDDGIIKRWPINPSDLVDQLCDSLPNEKIKEADWHRYIGDDSLSVSLYKNHDVCPKKSK